VTAAANMRREKLQGAAEQITTWSSSKASGNGITRPGGCAANLVMKTASWDGGHVEAIVLFYVHGATAGDRAW
jgi:hypothetical protein